VLKIYQINGNRLTSNDHFYSTTGKGGYSQFIQGKPVVNRLNILCNCISEVCVYFNKICSEVTDYKGMKFPFKTVMLNILLKEQRSITQKLK
jgi:hypothetical protein